METKKIDAASISMISASQLRHPDPHKASETEAGSESTFREMLEQSCRDPDEFWNRVALDLEWTRHWDSVRKGDLPHFEYYSGGISNVCVNLLDRQINRGMGNKVALIWEGEDSSSRFFTYSMLLAEVCKFANALKNMGVCKGDAVCIFLPNLPETVIAVLACYRLGAIFNTVFSGFSAEALRSRLCSFEPKIVITADGGLRRGKHTPLKSIVDDAIRDIESVKALIVVKRSDASVEMVPGRDAWWHDVTKGLPIVCAPEPVEANEPGLVFYTSGTTGKPKGVVHSGMGFLVNNYVFAKYQMDHQPDDVLWCTADIGWLTMHIWGIVGALSNGVTTLFFEGALDYPTPDRFYQIVEKYRVNKIFSAPTAIRMLMKHGADLIRGYDVSCISVLSLVGEPFNPEAWIWFDKQVGQGKVFINNTWGQTEMGGCPLSGAAWLTATKPGSCGIRFLGMDVDVVDDRGQSLPANLPGSLVIRRPFPMMIRTLWKEPDRFVEEYFSQIKGCYYTYDSAIRDNDGHFWVLGRLDDVINVSGHRLSTMEIESAIMGCPAVAEVAVIGAPDSVKGLVPIAFVTLKSGQAQSDTLDNQIRIEVETRLSKIACPAWIYFVEVLPKTPSGKIMRRLLREIVDGDVHGDLTGLENVSSIDQIASIVSTSRDAGEVLGQNKSNT